MHSFVKKKVKKKKVDHFINRKKHLKSIELCRDHRQYTRSLERKQAIHHNRYSTAFREKHQSPTFPGERKPKNNFPYA